MYAADIFGFILPVSTYELLSVKHTSNNNTLGVQHKNYSIVPCGTHLSEFFNLNFFDF